MAVTTSIPSGAVVAAHEPVPSTKAVTVHNVVDPTVNVTVPLGVPPEELTLAEKVTLLPAEVKVGLTEGEVVVATSGSVVPPPPVVPVVPPPPVATVVVVPDGLSGMGPNGSILVVVVLPFKPDLGGPAVLLLLDELEFPPPAVCADESPVTVTEIVLMIEPDCAVTEAFPGPTATTSPFETDTIPGSLLDQWMPAIAAGGAVAPSLILPEGANDSRSPTVIVRVSGLMVKESKVAGAF